MAKYELVECDHCGKARRKNNPFDEIKNPEEHENYEEHQIATWVHISVLEASLTTCTFDFCSKKCAREKIVTLMKD